MQKPFGEDFWKRFNAGKEEQKWHYQSLAKVFLERGQEFKQPLLGIAEELSKNANQIFKD